MRSSWIQGLSDSSSESRRVREVGEKEIRWADDFSRGLDMKSYGDLTGSSRKIFTWSSGIFELDSRLK